MSEIAIGNFFLTFSKVVTGLSCCISFPLYVMVLYVIWKGKRKWPFNSCYFNIYIALGVVDLTSYLYYVIKKLPYWDVELFIFLPYDANNWFCCVLYFGIWWFAFAQYQLTILITVNRFVSIMFHTFYVKWWTNSATNKMITAIFVECAALALPIFGFGSTIATSKIRFDDTIITRHSGPVFMNALVGSIYNWMWKAHIYFIIAICLVLYMIMFIKIREIQSKSSKNSKLKAEIKIMYSALVLFAMNCFFVFYFIIRDSIVATNPNFGKFTEWTLYMMSDIYDLHNGVAIFLLSKEVRKAILKTVKSNDDSHSHNITVVAVQPAMIPVSHSNSR